MNNNDGKIDFSKYSNQDLLESQQRIDKSEFPLNFQAATKEIESRKANGHWSKKEVKLDDLDHKVRFTFLIGFIVFSLAAYVINFRHKEVFDRNISILVIAVSFYLFLKAIEKYWASFKCPVCNTPLGQEGVKRFIKEKQCIHCGNRTLS